MPVADPGAAADFREAQRRFAAHLRDPAVNPAPAGIEDRRLAIYRDLFFRNIDNFLRGFFPVLHSLYGEDEWLALSRQFFAQHPAQTPYFLQIAEEFLAWLENGFQPRPADPPCMKQLAHYEWLELALDVAEEDFPVGGFDADGDLLAGAPMPSPLAVLAHYDWPVHEVSAGNRDPAARDTWLMVYRDRSEQVRFMEMNAVAARLFSLLQSPQGVGCSGRELAQMIAAELQHPEPAAVVAGAGQLLADWRAREVVLGTRLR
jgi:hypothetical protein